MSKVVTDEDRVRAVRSDVGTHKRDTIARFVEADPEVVASKKVVDDYHEMVKPSPQGGAYNKKEKKQLVALQKKHQELVEKKDKKLRMAQMEAFLTAWVDNNGNQTKAMMDTFGMDRITANSSAPAFLKKNRWAVNALIEKEGITFRELMRLAIDKMQKSRDTDWFDRMMTILGYGSMLPGSTAKQFPQIVNIVGSHENLQKEYGFTEGEIVEEKDDKQPEEL